MTTNETALDKRVTYPTTHGSVDLSIRLVQQFFCPKATPLEATTFIQLCRYQALNPFLKEAHLIKYSDSQAASIVVGKDTFTQRAESEPSFDGYRAGVIVRRGGEIVEEDGSFLLADDDLVGGWFEGRRKDWSAPFKHKVAFSEYGKGQAMWKYMPATMIRKVALVQGLREMFPKAFVGLYDASEMGTPIDKEGNVLSGTVGPQIAQEPEPKTPEARSSAPSGGAEAPSGPAVVPEVTYEAEARPVLKTTNDLFAAAFQRWGKPHTETLGALGHGSASLIPDLDEAWSSLKQLWSE
jgi:phage recombination protein Bet